MARVKTIPLFTNDKTQQQSSGTGYQKKLAEMLMSDQPKRVWSTGEGLLSAGSTLMGAFLAKRAEDKESQDEENAWSELSKVMTGASGLGNAPSPFGSSSSETSSLNPLSSGGSVTSGRHSGGASRSAALNERKQRALTRLVEKGYTEHAAQGIVDNLADESSLDPRQVGDNGTAFGLAQHRKERFAALKKFASERGKPFHDFDTNLDFIDHELRNGPDEGAKIAFAKLQAAGDADTAYDAFLEHFERPSRENLAKRRRGGRNYAQAGAVSQEPGGPDLTMWQGQARQGAQLMQSRNPVLRRHGLNLLTQAQQAIAEAQTRYSQDRLKGQDEESRTERRIRLETEAAAERAEHAANLKEDEGYTLSPGAARYRGRQKIAEQPRGESQGIVVGQDENGRPMISIGGSGRPPTEMNQKYEQFYRRGSGANTILDQTDESLAKAETYIRELGPQVAQDYLLSDEYKIARQAADDFLITIIRPDTGAAVTDTEFRIYGSIFLPRPNDSPALIAQKRDSRRRALEALKAGMKPEQVLRLAAPDKFDGTSIVPKDLRKNKTNDYKPGPKDEPMPPGISGEDKELWEFMSSEDREKLRKHYGSK